MLVPPQDAEAAKAKKVRLRGAGRSRGQDREFSYGACCYLTYLLNIFDRYLHYTIGNVAHWPCVVFVAVCANMPPDRRRETKTG